MGLYEPDYLANNVVGADFVHQDTKLGLEVNLFKVDASMAKAIGRLGFGAGMESTQEGIGFEHNYQMGQEGTDLRVGSMVILDNSSTANLGTSSRFSQDTGLGANLDGEFEAGLGTDEVQDVVEEDIDWQVGSHSEGSRFGEEMAAEKARMPS